MGRIMADYIDIVAEAPNYALDSIRPTGWPIDYQAPLFFCSLSAKCL